MSPRKKTKPKPAAPVRHRPTITRSTDHVGATLYLLTCPCGVELPARYARRLADVDRTEHLAALPRVPAAQQCRDPRRHDRRHWEPCEMCEHQTALFDLEEAG